MKSSIKKQETITTIRVFTENNRVYTHNGRSGRFYMPLRWVPVSNTKA